MLPSELMAGEDSTEPFVENDHFFEIIPAESKVMVYCLLLDDPTSTLAPSGLTERNSTPLSVAKDHRSVPELAAKAYNIESCDPTRTVTPSILKTDLDTIAPSVRNFQI